MLKLLKRFKHYLINTSWIIGEKALTMGIGFLVTVLVARYLGPNDFGLLSYARSMAAIFAVAGHMGLSGLVIREIVQKPTLREETLGTSLGLKMVGVFVGFLLLVGISVIKDGYGSIEFWVTFIVGASILFRPFDVIDYWFQAYVQAKYTSVVRASSLLLVSAFKLILISLGVGLISFAYSNLVQTFLAAIFFMIMFQLKSNHSVANWKFNFQRAKELLGQSWMVFLGAFFANLYLKFDQIMLKWFVDSQEVGIYAVAVRLSEIWYILPAAIVASVFPKLIKLKELETNKYRIRLQQLFDLLFASAFIVAIVMTFLSSPIINIFFGPEYAESAIILSIHIWAALFIFMRSAFSKWILIEDALAFSLITQAAGAVANIGFNLLLIPKYGGCGAAIATLVSYAMASYFSLLFYKRSRPVFIIMTKSIVFPFRYLYRYFKFWKTKE